MAEMKSPPIQLGTFMLLLGATLLVALIGCFVYAVHGALKEDGKPIVQSVCDFPSPDMKWMATLELVDNGLGFGQGMLYDEVHIRRPYESISGHGDRDESAVFYIDVQHAAEAQPPRVTWKDPTHVVIAYDPRRSDGAAPGKRVSNFHGISVDLMSVAKPVD